MALYLGNSEKLKIIMGNVGCKLNLFNVASAIDDGVLISLDNFKLCDCNGLYLIAKEDK